MNLPYTMPPDEAAETVKAFHPRRITIAVRISAYFRRGRKAPESGKGEVSEIGEVELI